MRVATEYDREWIRRRRKVNTLLVVLFVFRLVFAPDRQGYAATLHQVWEQCRQLELPLPSARPVAASSICDARAKVRDQAFRDIHRAILARAPADNPRWLWRGHRAFAVDGSKLNLPRPLLHNGYRTPSDSSHYPQGLLSCLYQLRARLPIDVDLSSHSNERAAALTHLPALRPGDVVVYDRGYYSFLMLHAHAQRGLQPVFRLQSNASALVADFVRSERTDEIVTVRPSDGARSQQPQADLRPVRARLVKYTHGGTDYALATTLLDRERYPVKALSDLYHARWGIEELYKVAKRLVGLEPFHGQSERGVRQELWAACSLIAMARLSPTTPSRISAAQPGRHPCRPTSATACARSASISKGCSCSTTPRWATPSRPSWPASSTAASASVRTVPTRGYPAGPTTDSDLRSRKCPLLQPESSNSRHPCLHNPIRVTECV